MNEMFIQYYFNLLLMITVQKILEVFIVSRCPNCLKLQGINLTLFWL